MLESFGKILPDYSRPTTRRRASRKIPRILARDLSLYKRAKIPRGGYREKQLNRAIEAGESRRAPHSRWNRPLLRSPYRCPRRYRSRGSRRRVSKCTKIDTALSVLDLTRCAMDITSRAFEAIESNLTSPPRPFPLLLRHGPLSRIKII